MWHVWVSEFYLVDSAIIGLSEISFPLFLPLKSLTALFWAHVVFFLFRVSLGVDSCGEFDYNVWFSLYW